MKNHAKLELRLKSLEGQNGKQRVILLDCMNQINQLNQLISMIMSMIEKERMADDTGTEPHCTKPD